MVKIPYEGPRFAPSCNGCLRRDREIKRIRQVTLDFYDGLVIDYMAPAQARHFRKELETLLGGNSNG